MNEKKNQEVWVYCNKSVKKGEFIKDADNVDYCVVLFPKDQEEVQKSLVFNSKKKAVEKLIEGLIPKDIDCNSPGARDGLVESILSLKSGQSLDISKMMHNEDEPCVVRVNDFSITIQAS